MIWATLALAVAFAAWQFRDDIKVFWESLW